jgi:hypothetical protein
MTAALTIADQMRALRNFNDDCGFKQSPIRVHREPTNP